MKKLLTFALAAFAIAAITVALPAGAAADSPAASVAKKGKGHKGKKKNKKNKKTFVVCAHGCKYKTISKAVKKVKKKNSTIKVKPGKYTEGVIVEGHKYDGLTIKGTNKNAKKVILEGKNAKGPNGLAQNGIEAVDVNDVTLKNMWARNYATNGFFLRDSAPGPGTKIDCNDYLMKNLIASDNRSYGLYVFGCAGGRMTKSEGWGHGDSAFYVGATPIQKKPKTTRLDHLDAHENVLGYSGTNSHYVDISKSYWYNNGIGIVPNTLDSEPFEPTGSGTIHDNWIFWNNFNYFLPKSGVETVSGGLGEFNGKTLNYPTGVGVALFGATGWTVENNEIFGNFKWGSAAFSDPFNDGDDAISTDNQFLNNKNGRGGSDTNAVDFWVDGSGSGNCFSGNSSTTFDPSDTATNAQLYPACGTALAPPIGGNGTSFGDPTQVGEILNYATSDPPETQECSWTQHAHPKFKKYKPVDVKPDPDCAS